MAEQDGDYAHSVRHYEFVAGQLTDYYRMYMQSWTVLITGVFVGGVFALKEAGDSSLAAHLLCILPLVMAGWFVLTGWFWGRFAMLRGYLQRLERGMKDPPQLFSLESKWMASRAGKFAIVFSTCVAGIVYLFLAFVAALTLSSLRLDYRVWLLLLPYCVVALGAVVTVRQFVRAVPSD
jgi:hypothetical protein